jgi:hypothetical protein
MRYHVRVNAADRGSSGKTYRLQKSKSFSYQHQTTFGVPQPVFAKPLIESDMQVRIISKQL